MRNQNRITPAQARQLMQQRAILWDVRTPAEYAAGISPVRAMFRWTGWKRSCRTCRPTATRSLSAAAAGSAAP